MISSSVRIAAPPEVVSNTDAGSIPARLTTSTCAAPRMSGARSPDSHPLRFPIGVRTASMITGCAMSDVLLLRLPALGRLPAMGNY